MIIAGHRDQKVVAYPMLALPGGKVHMNWIAELGRPGDAPPREDWNRRVDKSVFLEHFRGWKFDWLDVPAMIEATDVTYEFPKIDRNPVARWTYRARDARGRRGAPDAPGRLASRLAGDRRRPRARVSPRHRRSDPLQALQRFQDERLPAMRDITLSATARSGRRSSCRSSKSAHPAASATSTKSCRRPSWHARAAEFKEKAGFAVDALNRRGVVLSPLIRNFTRGGNTNDIKVP